MYYFAGAKFSGKVNDNNITTFTVWAADADVFKAVEKEITAQNKAVENTENTAKSNIIGNTKYADIPDKKYFKVDTLAVEKISAGLETLGVKFSGRANGDTTTFTVSAADSDKFREVEKAANAHKIPPVQQTVETPQKSLNTQKNEAEAAPGIIGNTKYVDIPDKKYFKIDSYIAQKVAGELEKQGVKFRGRIAGDKTTLTIGNADVDRYKAIFNAVKAAEAELKVTDKMPEKPENSDKETYSFGVYQVNDDNRDIRFATLKNLEDKGIDVNFATYDLIYKSEIVADGRTKEQLLEDIYTSFNVELSADFKGRSLSVSDVVVMEGNGEQTVHYCDNIGFREVENFFAEKVTEVDKSAPSVTDLKQRVDKGESISIMDLAKAVKNEKSTPDKPDFPEVYINNLSFAREHGEIAAYKESKQLDLDCAAAIDEAISANSIPGPMAGTQYVDTEKAMKDVVEKFGIERVKAVTATIVADQDWDGRLSNTNKNWAKNIDLLCHDVYTKTHLSIFDGFVDKVRNCEKILDKKPSIHDKLQAKPPENSVKNDGIKKNKGEAEL